MYDLTLVFKEMFSAISYLKKHKYSDCNNFVLVSKHLRVCLFLIVAVYFVCLMQVLYSILEIFCQEAFSSHQKVCRARDTKTGYGWLEWEVGWYLLEECREVQKELAGQNKVRGGRPRAKGILQGQD